MGNKTKTARFLREIRANDKVPDARQPHRPSGLYLVELRNHVAEGQTSKPKLHISIDPSGKENDRPKPIKITHL
jgi:hypothetical protein